MEMSGDLEVIDTVGRTINRLLAEGSRDDFDFDLVQHPDCYSVRVCEGQDWPREPQIIFTPGGPGKPWSWTRIADLPQIRELAEVFTGICLHLDAGRK